MRLRLVCEALGPTFVKLGQLLSTRPDLLPQAYVNELSKLRDDVKPFPYCEVEAILREEYGRDPLEIFDEIDPRPVASASISQVHRAKTHAGEDVALKVRRPGIEKTIHADLEIIKNLSQLAERRMPNLAGFGTVAIARELERSLKRELDLEIELRTIERCRKQMANEKNVHILKTYKELSTQRVLAMEYVNGVSVGDLEGIRRNNLEPKEIAARGARVFLTQIFIYGFFHADPHSGNLRIGSGGVIVPLDYGLFGHLDARTRERIADLIWGLVSQDVDRILGALEALGIQGDSQVSSAMRRDLAEIVAAYSDLNLESIDLSQLLRELVSLVSEHRLKIPPDLVLLIRALITIESVGRGLDPRFDIARQVRPFLRRILARRLSPKRLVSKTAQTMEDLQRASTLLPDLLHHAIGSIERGGFHVRFDVRHFENLVRQLTRAGNTLAGGVVVAGLIVGSAIIVHSDVGPRALGYVGFGAAVLMAFWLFWKMNSRT
jgi:ubiquinone biosynthesis protein